MHWDALGAVSELLGALGVIASLFYVASQIRRNSSALEASTNQAVSDSTQQRLLAPAQNPTLAAALANSRNSFDALTPTELVQLAFFSRATFRGIQNAFFQHRQGLLSEAAWQDYEAIIRNNLSRPDVPVWWPTERETYDEEFADYVDRLLAEGPAV
jgi:hypothetical protein